MKEKAAFHVNGYLGLLGAIIIGLISLWLMFVGFTRNFPVLLTIGIILFLIVILFSTSLTIIQPNEAKVLTFFGNYIGTIRDAGLFMTVPFTNKETVSLRVCNFNSQILKVNDSKGNPVEIAAVIVYKVVDTAKALFRLMIMSNLFKFKVSLRFVMLLVNIHMIVLKIKMQSLFAGIQPKYQNV